MATTFLSTFFLGLERVITKMYYILVKGPLTAPLYEYFASAAPRQNTRIMVQ